MIRKKQTILDTLRILTDYINNNPKDFANICFWIVTVLIALSTYINAKKTLFNPIRSEMVKYQMKVITDFINNHTTKGFTLENSIDYSNLIKLNWDVDYLFHISNNESRFSEDDFDEVDKERIQYCRGNLDGLFEVSTIDKKLILEPYQGDFDTIKQYVQTKFIKEKERNTQRLVLQRFYLSKKFYSIYTDLINLQTNPFVPQEIKSDAKFIISNIYKNIQILYELLSKHILEQKDITYQEIYSEFDKKRIDHQKDFERLHNSISAYFKVNKA